MPFKSEAQRRKMGQLMSEGKISKQTFDEWADKTPKNIPERKGKKRGGKK